MKQQKKYWLWLGLVLAIISAPTYLLSQTDSNLSDAINYFYLPTTLYILSGPGMIFGERQIIGQIIVVMLNGFLYGAIIGWIYGKVRKQKQVGTTTD